MNSSPFLIAGCGYIGQALAKSLNAAGHEVIGLTHSKESAKNLGQELGIDVFPCDLGSRSAIANLAGQITEPQTVIHCASSGRGGLEAYEKVYLRGCENLLGTFTGSGLLFTSSTSVYSQTDGSEVTENSPAKPERDTGKVLRYTEDLVLQAGGIVTRLAGLYGPERSVLLTRFLTGEAKIEAGTSRWMNQIHRNDVVSALTTLLHAESEVRGQIFNVSDGNPTTQRSCYKDLAAHFDKPVPEEAPPDLDRKRGWTHKRVSSAKLREFGWHPRYGSFLEAVREDSDLVPSIKRQIAEKVT